MPRMNYGFTAAVAVAVRVRCKACVSKGRSR